jgi:hypothetical protein
MLGLARCAADLEPDKAMDLSTNVSLDGPQKQDEPEKPQDKMAKPDEFVAPENIGSSVRRRTLQETQAEVSLRLLPTNESRAPIDLLRNLAHPKVRVAVNGDFTSN